MVRKTVNGNINQEIILKKENILLGLKRWSMEIILS